MKRNNLTTALIAGIAGVAGIASVSTAVNLNSDGVGQVLIYPYYTVNNGNNTLISVVNTTEDVKAVKVRFLEGKNSRECLDFNLYLSPYDVWTAALVAQESSIAGHVGEQSVKLITHDTSCIVPSYISTIGQEFLPYAFTGAFDDEISTDMSRCTEGHFEMIEMGTVVAGSASADAATHDATGVPADCGLVHHNWDAGQLWTINPNDEMDAPDGSGGLFGSTSIINVPQGTDVSYNADAIEGYSTNIQHSDPGSLLPNLKTGLQFDSNIFYQAGVVTSTWLGSSVEAVSALYMHNNVYGEYVIDETIGADTEWVVTFPTKFAYVDSVGATGSTTWGAAGIPFMPFTKQIAAGPDSIGACEPYAVTGVYDREEQSPTTAPSLIVPSPTPPGIDPTIPVFCWETNVLEFNNAGDVLGNSAIFGSNNTTHITPGFAEGWVSISFAQFTNNNASVPALTYTGLPVTGFAVQKYVNGALAGGTLANYAGLFSHRYSKDIQ